MVYQYALEEAMENYQGKFKVYNLMYPVMEEIKKEAIEILKLTISH